MRCLLLISLLLLAAAPAAAQHGFGAREQWQPQLAPADPRLDQPVEIELIGRAAVPVTEMLSEATGVSLGVAPEDLATVGERKLTIISNGPTLKTIMVQIPEALQECHWDIDTSGDEPVYLLHRNAGAGQTLERQQASRREHATQRVQELRAACLDDVRRALAMSPEELAELEQTDLFLARAARHPDFRALMQSLLELKNNITARKSTVDVHPGTGLSKMEPRLNINKIEGGLKVNIVPDQCVISVDRRLIPEENLAEAERELMDALSSVEGVNWGIENTFRIPTVPPCRDPIVDELSEIIEQVTGQSGKFGMMGSGDLPYIVTSEWSAKEFGLGVIRAECNIHGKDEFVYEQDIEDLAQIISRFLYAS